MTGVQTCALPILQSSFSKDKTPLWLNANKHGLSSLDEFNGYVRGAVIRPLSTDSARRWAIGYGVDVAVPVHYTSNVVVQQAFAEARWLHGVLSVGDSVVYAGEWRMGKRWGKGIGSDSTGRRIVGTWRADTLVSGTWRDSTGTYTGTLNRDGIADGHGTFVNRQELYQGEWADGKRSGFGVAINAGKHLQLGEWKNNRFLGERLNYTADRIYGIDISRFQHDVGRRRYPIHWNQVRISHLGTISKKTVTGAVNYPVSFCYIKSTEGRTIRNRYFRADYTAARRQGIPVGAYHFFSTKTSGAIQANYFLRNTIFKKGDMPPVLDLEPTHQQIKKMGGPGAMFAAVRTWMRMVERHTGTRPVLYISQMFVNRYLPMAPDLKANYNIWIARYGEYKPDVHLVYWQLCPDGRVRGITPKVDINVFNGYRSEFEDFLRKNCIP